MNPVKSEINKQLRMHTEITEESIKNPIAKVKNKLVFVDWNANER